MIEKTEEILEQFRQDNQDMKEAIVSFDCVLSTKANSFSITETKKWAEE